MKTTENSSKDFNEEVKRLFSGMLLGSLLLLISAVRLSGQCSILLSSETGTDNQTVCINTAITDITYITAVATGAVFSGLPGGVTGSWVDNVVTITGTPDVSGTFNFTVTATGGTCENITASGTISVVADNTITLTSGEGTDNQTLCFNSAITDITYSVIGATNASVGGLPQGLSAYWESNEVLITGTPTETGSFNYTINLSGGCGNITESGYITVNSLPSAPVITPVGPITFCLGGSVTLTSSDGTTYLWSTGATTQSINVTETGSYTVQITDNNGCQSAASAAIEVTVNPLPGTPTITPSGPTTFCAGGSVTLTSSPGATYLWSTGAITESINVTESGSYTVQITDGNGCQSAASAAIEVTVNSLPPAPTISASGSLMFCDGGSVTLTSSDGTTYLWSTGETTKSIDVNESGSYTVQITDGNGCQSAASAAIEVTVNSLPLAPTISASGSLTFCDGGSVTLTSSDGMTYLWSTGETTKSIDVNESGSYTVQITDGNGCLSDLSEATVVTVNPLPGTPTITPSGPTTFCAGGSVTLTSSPGATYLWSTGATTESINVTESGSYTVQITDGNGCLSAQSVPVIVTIDQLPTIATIATTPLNYCGPLTSGILGGNTPSIGTGAWSLISGGTGSFSNLADGNSTFTATSTGTYILRWTISNGTCTPSSAEVTVNFYKNFTASFVSGWNWFSVNTLHENMSLNNILATGFTDGDYIKNQTSFAFYSSEDGWQGSFSMMDPNDLYIVRVQNAAAIDFCGTPVNVNATPIPVVAGWNWVGYLPGFSLPISDALGSLTIATGDYVKNQTGYAEYYGTEWFGSLLNLNPGEGYMMRLKNTGELIFPDPPAKNSLESAILPVDNSFSPHKYEFNGSVTAELVMAGITEFSEKDILYAYADDEIRGIAHGMFLESKDSFIFPLMIHSNKPEGETISFRYYNSEQNKFYSCLEDLTFKADMVISNTSKPFSINVLSDNKSALNDAASDLQFRVYPNPFESVLNIGFNIHELSDVRVTVSDQYGNIIKVLIDQPLTSDNYTLQWICEGEPAGLYVVSIRTGNLFKAEKVLRIQ